MGGRPATAEEAFRQLQNNRLVGMLRLDLPTVAAMPLYYLVFLGLFAAMRRVDRASALPSTCLAFVGVTLSLATPTTLPMIALSERYAAAATGAVTIQLLAAGEAIMATDIWHGTGAFMGGILLECGAVFISIVMLRDGVFSKATAYVGLFAQGLDLAHVLLGLFCLPLQLS